MVANLRVDQAWGSAQIMGALHEVGGQLLRRLRPLGDAAIRATSWAYAVGAGIKLNAPMIGKGDYFQAEVNYTEGASRYIVRHDGCSRGDYRSHGDTTSASAPADAVFGGTSAARNATASS